MSDTCISSADPDLPIRPDQPWLAPLAGFSDLAFRLLCRHYGCSAAFTEMVSARGLIYQTSNTLDLLKTCPQDSPLIVQVYGSEPESITRAVSILLDQGFCYFDLNCGCPVKKVVKTGSGAALLKNPDLVVEMAQAMIQTAGQGRAGIKIRLGWNHDSQVYLELADKLSGTGLGWITLHPRTAVQLFSGSAHWPSLKKLKQATHIPVVASGDLFTAGQALECVSQTGVDNIMFARGALNNPAIFLEYIQSLKQGSESSGHPESSGVPLKDRILTTVHFYRKYHQSSGTLLKMRTMLPRMIREISGAKELRKELIMCRDWDAVLKVVEKI